MNSESETNLLISVRDYKNQISELKTENDVLQRKVKVLTDLINELKKEKVNLVAKNLLELTDLVNELKKEKVNLVAKNNELERQKKQIWDCGRVIDKYKKSLNYYMESQNANQQDIFQQMKYT